MILLADVKDWLKTVFEADHYYTGKLDNKKDRSIGVYQRSSYAPKRYAVGGYKKYDTKVDFLSMQVPESVDVGTDDKGIYERVIWFDIYYERKVDDERNS